MGEYLESINISIGEWEIFPYFWGNIYRAGCAIFEVVLGGFLVGQEGGRDTAGWGGRWFDFENAGCICFLACVLGARSTFRFLSYDGALCGWGELKRAVGAKWLMEVGLGGMRKTCKFCD